MKSIRLGAIAIARTPRVYEFLRELLLPGNVQAYFAPLGVGEVVRYDLPNLGAFNFILPRILDGGGSVSMRIDAQGKALGQILLEMMIDVPDDLLPELLPTGKP
jgi:hypothetical protein